MHALLIRIIPCKIFCLLVLLHCAQPILSQKKKTAAEDVAQTYTIKYELLENGDTINRIDNKNNKIGNWVFITRGGYGEPDIIWHGKYDNGIKTGVWKQYTTDGKIVAEEFYRKGNLDGEAKYYDEGHLYCIGNYLALRSHNEYDTILVEDPVTNMEKKVVIKTDVGSVRHGFWTYYDVPTRNVKRVVEYQADEIIYEKEYEAKVDSTYIKQQLKKMPHYNSKYQAENTMQDKNRKATRFTDFPENTQYVKPNVRQKK